MYLSTQIKIAQTRGGYVVILQRSYEHLSISSANPGYYLKLSTRHDEPNHSKLNGVEFTEFLKKPSGSIIKL